MAERASAWRPENGKLVHVATGRSVAAFQKGLMTDLPLDAMPSRPRGDARERTANLLIRDGVEDQGNHKEEELIGKHPDDGCGAFQSEGRDLGAILDDHYVVEARGGARFLFPFHTELPADFEFKG